MNEIDDVLNRIARRSVEVQEALPEPCGLDTGEPPNGTAMTTSPGNGFRSLKLVTNRNCRLVFRTDPTGLAAEQFRLFRRKLTVRFPKGATLLVTSPAPGDGKTLNSANLAWCLAESNGPTLLVEADLRRPSMSRLFGCSPRPGLEEALLGEVEPESVVRAIEGLPLCVAMAARAHNDPMQLLKDARFNKFLEWARAEFRWILFDAPPVFPVADVAELCPLADAALLIVRARSTPRELVLKALEALRDRLAGVILNDATLCLDSHYRYLSRYYNQYTRK